MNFHDELNDIRRRAGLLEQTRPDFDLFWKKYGEFLLEMLDVSDFPNENVEGYRDYVKQIYYSDVELLQRKYTSPTKIYRRILVDKSWVRNLLDYSKSVIVGKYWSESVYGTTGFTSGERYDLRFKKSGNIEVLLEGIVTYDSIDVDHTIKANISSGNEQEISLNEGAPVTITSVTIDGTKYDLHRTVSA